MRVRGIPRNVLYHLVALAAFLALQVLTLTAAWLARKADIVSAGHCCEAFRKHGQTAS
jgi:hypothetical protein